MRVLGDASVRLTRMVLCFRSGLAVLSALASASAFAPIATIPRTTRECQIISCILATFTACPHAGAILDALRCCTCCPRDRTLRLKK